MFHASRFCVAAFVVCTFCVLLWGCGSQPDQLISSLGSVAPDGTGLVQAPVSGASSHYNNDSSQIINIPAADPWGRPNLGRRGRSSNLKGSVPTLAQLQSRLDEEFARIGKDPSKVVAAVPTGSSNTVFDLVAETFDFPNPGVRLTWTERNIGDYDQNSEVNVADLTPIAIYYGVTPSFDSPADHNEIDYWPAGDPDSAGAENWRLAVVDGDSNGEVNLADISALALHYMERLDGYRVYRKLDGETSFTMLDSITNPGSTYTVERPALVAKAPVRYSFEDGVAAEGDVEYYVAAYDAASSQEGGRSNAVNITGASTEIPVARLHLDTDFGEAPLTVNFDATLSTDPDGIIEIYEFDFADGAGFVDAGSTTPQFVFTDNAMHTVSLRVTDNDGYQDTYSRNITAFNPGELVLPPTWDAAKANAGVSSSTMGAEELLPGLGAAYNGWTWAGEWVDHFTMLPSFWEAWYTDVEGYPEFLSNKTQGLSNAGGLQDLFLEANKETMVEHNITAQTHNSTLDPTHPLATAIFDLATAAGGTPDLLALQTDVAALTLSERQALANLVDATQQAMELREGTVLPFFLDNYDFVKELFDGAHGAGPQGLWALRVDDALMYYEMYIPEPDFINVRIFRQFPYSGLYEGTAIMADAVDVFSQYLTTNPTFGNVSVEVDTLLGRITLGGTNDDNHTAPLDGNGHILLIDLGGNDSYDCHAGANASEYNGTSICLDLSGNDNYNALDDPDDFDRSVGYSDDNTAQQGAGRFGIGMLVDFGGADTYTGVRMAQGCAVFGAGILADYGGSSDSYSFEALGQGAAFGGIGLLYDDGGADNYTCYSMAQGFGGIGGVGYLVDGGMDSDTYLAVVEMDSAKPEYIHLDLEGLPKYGTNSSIAQGASWGARWGWIELNADEDTWSVIASGGQGLLYDGGGSDSYTCGTFGQGTGLYEGMGVLIDLDGDDLHTGYAYTQGAALHAAVASVYDITGNDTWDNAALGSMGSGDDMSIAWFFDTAGNDIYHASELALGTGSANGFGYFLDYFGADTYNATYSNPASDNLGVGIQGGGIPTWPSYGIFVDAHGTDNYASGYQGMQGSVGLPGDGMPWTRIVDFSSDPPSVDDQQGFGAGVDGPLAPTL